MRNILGDRKQEERRCTSRLIFPEIKSAYLGTGVEHVAMMM